MNAKTQAAIITHGQNVLAIFPNATESDPVRLCRKLRKLEREGAALALRLCNGPAFATEDAAETVANNVLAKANALLGNGGGRVPLFLNLDPRGYALKIREDWMREWKPNYPIFRDWGGYGILAPDLTES